MISISESLGLDESSWKDPGIVRDESLILKAELLPKPACEVEVMLDVVEPASDFTRLERLQDEFWAHGSFLADDEGCTV